MDSEAQFGDTVKRGEEARGGPLKLRYDGNGHGRRANGEEEREMESDALPAMSTARLMCLC